MSLEIKYLDIENRGKLYRQKRYTSMPIFRSQLLIYNIINMH
jgi:hypothetical protein